MADRRVAFTPDPELFPFESRFFASSVGDVHYVDEGEGRPILLLHGNPDWSFLYRTVIRGLTDPGGGPTFRCVAPDYPGFGLSVHPEAYGYTAAEHAHVVLELVDHLGLDDLIVFGQDWGGPIGTWVAAQRADRVSGLAMGNTWAWPVPVNLQWLFSQAMKTWPARWFVLERNGFVENLLRGTLAGEVDEAAFAHYVATSPPGFRQGIAEFPAEITNARAWLGGVERGLRDRLADKPALLLRGPEDPVLGSEAVLGRWQRHLPDHVTVELPGASHFFQEDAPEPVVAAVRERFGG